MKISNPKTRSNEEQTLKPENVNTMAWGITKSLLEKYKSKHDLNIEKSFNKKNQKGMA